MDLVIVEGNISAGKSTEVETCESALKGLRVKTMGEVAPTPLLKDMYEGRNAYGFQLWMMAHRISQFDVADMVRDNTDLFITDRSMLGDIVFANVQALDGNITPQDMQTYKATLDEMGIWDRLGKVTRIFYLHVDPEQCRERCTKRGHDVENAVPVEYFRKVESIYFDALVLLKFMVYDVPVHVLKNVVKDTLHLGVAMVKSPDNGVHTADIRFVDTPSEADIVYHARPDIHNLGACTAATFEQKHAMMDRLSGQEMQTWTKHCVNVFVPSL